MDFYFTLLGVLVCESRSETEAKGSRSWRSPWSVEQVLGQPRVQGEAPSSTKQCSKFVKGTQSYKYYFSQARRIVLPHSPKPLDPLHRALPYRLLLHEPNDHLSIPLAPFLLELPVCVPCGTALLLFLTRLSPVRKLCYLAFLSSVGCLDGLFSCFQSLLINEITRNYWG